MDQLSKMKILFGFNLVCLISASSRGAVYKEPLPIGYVNPDVDYSLPKVRNSRDIANILSEPAIEIPQGSTVSERPIQPDPIEIQNSMSKYNLENVKSPVNTNLNNTNDEIEPGNPAIPNPENPSSLNTPSNINNELISNPNKPISSNNPNNVQNLAIQNDNGPNDPSYVNNPSNVNNLAIPHPTNTKNPSINSPSIPNSNIDSPFTNLNANNVVNQNPKTNTKVGQNPSSSIIPAFPNEPLPNNKINTNSFAATDLSNVDIESNVDAHSSDDYIQLIADAIDLSLQNPQFNQMAPVNNNVAKSLGNLITLLDNLRKRLNFFKKDILQFSPSSHGDQVIEDVDVPDVDIPVMDSDDAAMESAAVMLPEVMSQSPNVTPWPEVHA